MSFKQRTTKPEKGNKYYIRKASGGWSPCIQGSPVDSDCNVLSNCVGYAIGRFNEIGEWGCCKYLASVNAENFIQYKGSSLEVGQAPKIGACMVWQSGATLNGADGCGHVAIVEEVISNTEVLTSESAWGGTAFRNVARKKGSDGRWGMGSAYKFLGFIYNPAPCCQSTGGATTKSTKTVDELAEEVVAGKWGNGQERINRLTAAGYDAAAVQAAVNAGLSGGKTAAKKTVAEIAQEVILGRWGNGQERVDRLTAAGYGTDEIGEIQSLVNRRLS